MRSNAVYFRGALVLGVGLTAAGMASPASAQVEEILVTARKRTENIQEVPAVVAVLSQATIERKGIDQLEDLTRYTTGLIFDQGATKQDTRVVIRGLSPTRGRQNVAVLMDDVDISSEALKSAGGSFLINPRLFDLERIEIVKGPQSALYGRSAFAGAINYITRKPGDHVEGSVGVDIATYGKYEGRAGISGPIVPGLLSMGVNAAAWNFDGFYKSSVTNRYVGGGYGVGGSISAVLTPNDFLKVTARAEYDNDQFDVSARIYWPAPTTTTGRVPDSAVSGGVIAASSANVRYRFGSLGHASDYGLPASSTNPRTGEEYPGNSRELFRSSLRVDADLGKVNLISLAGFMNANTTQYEDGRGQGDVKSLAVNSLSETNQRGYVRQISEDLRAQTNDMGPFKATLGGLFWWETANQNNNSLICYGNSGGCGTFTAQIGNVYPWGNRLWHRDTRHYSIYGLVEYTLFDDFTLSAEFRQVWEKEVVWGPNTYNTGIGCTSPTRVRNPDGTVRCSAAGGRYDLSVVGGYTTGTTDTSYAVPRFAVDYKLLPDKHVYVSAAQAKKPGGINTSGAGGLGSTGSLDENRFEPESMWVYEVGAKTQWFDRRLLVNVAAYYQDFSAKQVSTNVLITEGPSAGQIGQRITNASSARVKGFEVDSSLVATSNLSLTLGYTYLDAVYRDFKPLTNSATDIARAGNCTVYIPPTGARQCITDLSGNRLEGAPKHQLLLGGRWKQPLVGDIDWYIETDARYQSQRFTDYNNNIILPSYWTADLRIGLSTARWEVTAYVNNLFDDDKLKSTGINIPDYNNSQATPDSPGVYSGVLANLPDKRQVGIRASYKF
jgi:iron complex outermembrane recepter protein